MPLKAYVGLPRSGKSYEVVTNVILVALRQGRRVVSNIAGLNYEAMCQVLYKEGHPQEKIGTLVCVDHAEVEKPSFWRTDTDNETGFKSFIQPGDLVALDEIWRFWKKRGDIHPRVMNFCRMHGHMTHPQTGLTCEIALITQSIRDINENIRDVVQETYQTVKNTKLGSDKSYIVHIFQRGSSSKGDFIRTLPPRFYNKEYFVLYKSHSQHVAGDAVAQEKTTDDRGNILKGALFKVGFPLALVLMLSGFYFVWKFLHPKSLESKNAIYSPAAVSAQSVGAVSAASRQQSEISDAWRVTGHYQRDSSINIAIQDSAGNIRVLNNPPNYKISALGVEVELPEGGFATSWTALTGSGRGVLPR